MTGRGFAGAPCVDPAWSLFTVITLASSTDLPPSIRPGIRPNECWLDERATSGRECVLFDVSGLRVHQRKEVPDRLLVVDHGGRPSVR
jgi:hypothetical protein